MGQFCLPYITKNVNLLENTSSFLKNSSKVIKKIKRQTDRKRCNVTVDVKMLSYLKCIFSAGYRNIFPGLMSVFFPLH